jgi:sphinganine-1-phosphate aldolase
MNKEELLDALKQFRAHDAPWRDGRVWAGVYDAGAELEALQKAAYTEFWGENALYINFYPSLLALEQQVLAHVKELLRAPSEAAGIFTSGGTESILLALKAARDQALAERGIERGEVVLARCTHPAFHKAAHTLGLTVRVTEITPDFTADANAYAAAINANTIMLVASAPCYSHGTIDPVAHIAALAKKHKLWLHVDACVGGLYLSHMRLSGEYAVPAFDFSIDGVSSISADLHKYGYAPRNASTVIFRNRALRRWAFYANAHTTGYALVNSTAASTRSGGPIAAAWATLQALGHAGYARIVRDTMLATRALQHGINALPGLRVLGAPAMCMFTVACDAANVFVLEDEMLVRGWRLQSQFEAPGTPANLHFSLNLSNVPRANALLADLQDALRAASAAPAPDISAALALVQSGQANVAALMQALGVPEGGLPQRWAHINTLLNALPDTVVDQLLVEYANSVY